VQSASRTVWRGISCALRLLKNRLIFLDGGKDDSYFLEHFVLLGNYVRDPDRFEAMDELFQEFLQQAGVAIPRESDFVEAQQGYQSMLDQAQAMRDEIANLEGQRETATQETGTRRQLPE